MIRVGRAFLSTVNIVKHHEKLARPQGIQNMSTRRSKRLLSIAAEQGNTVPETVASKRSRSSTVKVGSSEREVSNTFQQEYYELSKTDQVLIDLGSMVEATIISRPSKTIRSPYVADIKLRYDNDNTFLAHAPSLDCGGLVVPGSIVYCKDNRGSDKKTSFVCGPIMSGYNRNLTEQYTRSCIPN